MVENESQITGLPHLSLNTPAVVTSPIPSRLLAKTRMETSQPHNTNSFQLLVYGFQWRNGCSSWVAFLIISCMAIIITYMHMACTSLPTHLWVCPGLALPHFIFQVRVTIHTGSLLHKYHFGFQALLRRAVQVHDIWLDINTNQSPWWFHIYTEFFHDSPISQVTKYHLVPFAQGRVFRRSSALLQLSFLFPLFISNLTSS